MIALLNLAVFGFLALSLLYLLLSVYFRSLERERLEKQWDAGGVPGDRDDHVRRGLDSYNHSLRHRLIWLVYIIPTVTVVTLVWILNFD